MAENSGFFSSVSGDRKYTVDFLAKWIASIIGNGVYNGELTVAPGDHMQVIVPAGRAWINGYYYRNDGDLPLAIANADGVLSRKDIVVLRWDANARNITAQILRGTPASNPIAPQITRSSEQYDLKLAEISIPAGTTAITGSLITDTRLNKDVCGIVTGVVQQVDTTTFYNQIQADLTEFKQSNEADFAAWMQSIRDILDSEMAGNLLNKINELAGEGRTTETVKANTDAIAAHVANTSNPHKVTVTQIGAVPTSRTVNSKALSGNITLDNTDVGAAPRMRSFDQVVAIASNTDFDTNLDRCGRYCVYTNGAAASCHNCPIPEAGYLDVYTPGGANNVNIIQRYMPYNASVVFKRNYDWGNKSWSSWQSISGILASGSTPGDNGGMFYYEKYADGRMHEWGYWSMLFNVAVAYGNMYQYNDLTCGLVDEWPSFAGTTHMTLSIDSTGRLVPVGGRVEGRTIHFDVLSPVVVNNLSTTIRFDIWGRWK